MKQVKTPPKQYCEHGLNDQERILVIRRPSCFTDQFYETFFTYDPELNESVQYGHSATKELLSVNRMRYADNHPAIFESRGAVGCGVSTYAFSAGKLTTEQSIHEDLAYNQGVSECRYIYFYDSQGTLVRIEAIASGARHAASAPVIVYRRPPPGQTIKDLSIRVEHLLAQQIPLSVAAAHVSELVYSLLLVYDMENYPTPPMLAVGPSSLREQVLKEHAQDARCYLWNPADYPHFSTPELELTDPELVEACELLNQQMTERDNCRPARTLLNKVAADLQCRDWRGILNITDDFVVAAVDLEAQDDLQANIKKSAPPELIKRLKHDGYL